MKFPTMVSDLDSRRPLPQLTTMVKSENQTVVEVAKEEVLSKKEGICYDPRLYAPFRTIGGKGGGAFRWVHGAKGLLVSKIQTWVGGHTLRGLKLTLSDGQHQTFGRQEDKDAGEIILSPGERVTSLSIWGNSGGTRCGGFRLETSKGQTYFPTMYYWDLETEYSMDGRVWVPLRCIWTLWT